VDTRSEIREFLTSRRARLTPDVVGLPVVGQSRRVPGLRREEVALLAGVSVEYYSRIERGHMDGASDSVLESLARALRLDEVERAHLLDLARATSVRPGPRPQATIRPSVQGILDAMTGAPAYVRNGRGDILAANRLAHALFSDMLADPVQPANTARFVFLDSRATDFFVEWDSIADNVVAVLRSEAGRNPHDEALVEFVSELSTLSEPFRTRWQGHDVAVHTTGVKRFRHPVVGELALTFESLALAADPGLAMAVYTAESGSKSQEVLSELASWAATDLEPR
jgi:transcriptional regulator with XRE-family HTH domain